MISDGHEVPGGSVIAADVCVVGGGAAGITIAQALAGTNLRVVVLESGGLTPDPASQDLNDGEVVGLNQPPLITSRLRFFGGTTNHWAGWSRPFDPEDFERRPWVPESGWPISMDDLEPYYGPAHVVCDLPSRDYSEETWGSYAAPIGETASQGLRTILIQLSKPTRFGRKFGDPLSRAENVEVLLNSNAIEIVPDPQARTVRYVQAATLDGNRYRVTANRYVLACGAIENARLLLSSSRVSRAGLGNDHDLVGRYFMDHPQARPAGVLFWRDAQAQKLGAYGDIPAGRALLAMGPDRETQKRESLCNSAVFLEGESSLEEFASRLPREASIARFLQGTTRGTGAGRVSQWWVRSEQSPNRESRVRLGSERDALGMPRPVLDWRVHELDRRTLARTAALFQEVFTREGLARVQIDRSMVDPDGVHLDALVGDWHHMGTTRMAASPADGVVDSDCRVHGVDNLYVAGASVFPTSSVMNPTLTLVALALRLADRLRRLA